MTMWDASDLILPQIFRKLGLLAFRIFHFQLGVSSDKGENVAPNESTFRLSDSTEKQT